MSGEHRAHRNGHPHRSECRSFADRPLASRQSKLHGYHGGAVLEDDRRYCPAGLCQCGHHGGHHKKIIARALTFVFQSNALIYMEIYWLGN